MDWSFASRRKLLEHFLDAGKRADRIEPAALDQTLATLRLPRRDLQKLRRFARRDLPRMATRAAVIDRLENALEGVAKRPAARRSSD